MIEPLKEIYYQLLTSNKTYLGLETVKKGMYDDIPTSDQPCTMIDWDENLDFTATGNHTEIEIGLEFFTIITLLGTPDEVSAAMNDFLWGFDEDSGLHSGLIPLLQNNRSVTLTNGPTLLGTVKPRELLVTYNPNDNNYTASSIIHMNFQSMVRQISIT